MIWNLALLHLTFDALKACFSYKVYMELLEVSQVNLLADSNIGSFKDADSVTNIPSWLKHITLGWDPQKVHKLEQINFFVFNLKMFFFSCFCSDAHNNADPKDLSNALLPCGLSLVYEAFLEDNAFSLKKHCFNWREPINNITFSKTK